MGGRNGLFINMELKCFDVKKDFRFQYSIFKDELINEIIKCIKPVN